MSREEAGSFIATGVRAWGVGLSPSPAGNDAVDQAHAAEEDIMAKDRVRDVMTMSPTTLRSDQTVTAAARIMEAENVGDVIVSDDSLVRGVVTDRDVAIRAVARGLDPKTTTLREICSDEPITVGSDVKLDQAADVMSRNAIRRLPVVDDGKLVGVVSLGDVAARQEPASVLGEISTAPPNR
jgi:CBS domain-containing protein